MGEEHGRFVVFGVCSVCTTRFGRLPNGTRHKLLNGVSARAAADPQQYFAGLFSDRGAARITAGMLCTKDAPKLVELLGWAGEATSKP